ncbi:unnamed protein product [Peniophora sp. CBMAI 1063]|nr:unnamed protein product [Peniophora sp. CBMAI 1063]
MPARDLTTKGRRRTTLRRCKRAAGFIRLCVLPRPEFTIPRSRSPDRPQPFITSKWSSQSALNGALASSVSHRSLNSHHSRARGRHSPPIETSDSTSRQFLSPHYALGRSELERRSFPRYGELGPSSDPGHGNSPPLGQDSEAGSDRARVRTLSEPTKLPEDSARAAVKLRSVSQPVPPFVPRLSSEALNVPLAAKLLTPIMEDAPTLHANALLYPSLSSSLDVMHEGPSGHAVQPTDTAAGSPDDEDALNDDLSAVLPSVILTAATPFESGSEQPVLVFTPPTTPQKRRVSTASTETYAAHIRRSDSTVYHDCESIHSGHDSPRIDMSSEDGFRGRRRSSSLSERHHHPPSVTGGPSRRPSVVASQHTRRSVSRERSKCVSPSARRTRSGDQPLNRRSSYDSALSFSDSVALTLAYLNGQTPQDTNPAPLSRQSSRAGGLRIATDISPRLSGGPITEFSPTETAVGTPQFKGKGSDRRGSWADKLANKLAYLVRSPTRTRSLRLSRGSRLSAPIETPVPIPGSA